MYKVEKASSVQKSMLNLEMGKRVSVKLYLNSLVTVVTRSLQVFLKPRVSSFAAASEDAL